MLMKDWTSKGRDYRTAYQKEYRAGKLVNYPNSCHWGMCKEIHTVGSVYCAKHRDRIYAYNRWLYNRKVDAYKKQVRAENALPITSSAMDLIDPHKIL